VTRTLDGQNIVKRFRVPRGGRAEAFHAVNGVSLGVDDGEIVGVVGESGCGKTTLARIMIGIEPATTGDVVFEGAPIVTRDDWRRLRRSVQYVFQDPATSLCPTMRIGEALAEPLLVHGIGTHAERAAKVRDTLRLVGLDADVVGRLPIHLSGGQRQRVSLARALIIEPRIVICDEIVSGLDVSVQAQVLTLITDLQRRLGLGLIFISHDLRVVHYLCDRVVVMYLGQIVEEGSVDEVFGDPRHPYTRALLAAVPADPEATGPRGGRGLRGEPASLFHLPEGCHFADRCPDVMPVCRHGEPPLRRRHGHMARCVAAWADASEHTAAEHGS
jgi:oligopeptide/dipeptide ABC transporter ATP-binding protein